MNAITRVKRGLASADEATRKRVAKTGGMAPHTERGLKAASRETRGQGPARRAGTPGCTGGDPEAGLAKRRPAFSRPEALPVGLRARYGAQSLPSPIFPCTRGFQTVARGFAAAGVRAYSVPAAFRRDG